MLRPWPRPMCGLCVNPPRRHWLWCTCIRDAWRRNGPNSFAETRCQQPRDVFWPQSTPRMSSRHRQHARMIKFVHERVSDVSEIGACAVCYRWRLDGSRSVSCRSGWRNRRGLTSINGISLTNYYSRSLDRKRFSKRFATIWWAEEFQT